MGIYKRINQSSGTQTELYANVKEDGSKAIVHSSFGTKVYKKVEEEQLDEDLLLKIKSDPELDIRKLMPYIDALGNYIFLTNKPKINGVTLEGNKTSKDLKIYGQIDANGVFFEDGESLQQKFDDKKLGVDKYSDLKEKPIINGVELNGELTTASLGIVDDTNINEQSTWSSSYIQQKLNNFSVTTELVGTDENPIIASELSVGSYVLSGKIQSSRENLTTIRLTRRKQYMVNKDVVDTTILWESTPDFTKDNHIQKYIVFRHKLLNDNLNEPQINTIELITKSSLLEAQLDCGNFGTYDSAMEK